MFDTHIHTKFSTDSMMTIEDAIQKADSLNIGLIITDHLDLNYPDENKFKINLNDYFNTYSSYKNEKLLLGIELGMDIAFKDENKSVNDNYPFDQIIGSQHFVDGIDIYDQRLYKNREKQDVFTSYFENMINSLKTHKYIDTLAHIDYISRYCPYDNNELNYKDFSDYIDEVLKLCLDEDITLELNTKRVVNSDSLKCLIPIYKRYKDLGGKYLTLGSDAHNPDAIANNFKSALDFCDFLDLQSVCYKERKRVYNR